MSRTSIFIIYCTVVIVVESQHDCCTQGDFLSPISPYLYMNYAFFLKNSDLQKNVRVKYFSIHGFVFVLILRSIPRQYPHFILVFFQTPLSNTNK
jgi:hypothetical protein